MMKKETFEQPPYDAVDEIPTNRLDSPKIVMGKNGKIAYGTDEGIDYKPVNEDAQVINTEANAFISIDGMGGMGHGEKAARILAEETQKGFRERLPMADIQRNASLRMGKEGVGNGGACYITGIIRKEMVQGVFPEVFLDVYQAGDARLVVVDKNGKVKFETEDEGYGIWVNNAVQGTRIGETTHRAVRLKVGDRIIAASDGLWDNFESQGVADIVSGKPIDVAIAEINRLTKQKMKSGGKKDNLNIIIYDFEREA